MHIASILEQARGNVVRVVNTQMVLAYWLIGREIVQELQGGEERAAYGKRVFEDLSHRLAVQYGKGFSVTNLKYFRLFYQAYPERLGIRHPTGDESEITSPAGMELALPSKSYLLGSQLPHGFSPQLTWSHYRALMRVDHIEARDFYEKQVPRQHALKFPDNMHSQKTPNAFRRLTNTRWGLTN